MTRIVFEYLADKLVLRPTRHKVSSVGKTRRMIPATYGDVEVWTQLVRCQDEDEAEVCVLKFPGVTGRAERATYAPFDHWPELRGIVWAVNPPGYGGSAGPARLRLFAEAAQAAYSALAEVANGRPIVVVGNSLGTVLALYLSATVPVAGLILRNPPPLRELIIGHHGWWNLWLGAALIAGQVPQELCSITNAAKSTSPAVFVACRQDRTVPRVFQQKVIRSYKGPRRVVRLRNADHATPMTPWEHIEYGRQLRWLRQRILRDYFIPEIASTGMVAEGSAESSVELGG